jgi:moderate conductance mechanosensitive channel
MDFALPDFNKIFDPSDVAWFSIITALVILFIVQQVIHRVIGQLIDRAIRSHKYTTAKERKKRRDTLVSVFSSISTALLVVIAIIVVLNQLGVNIAALIAGFGALGFVLGVAGQDVIKDFLKGLSIIMYDQYRVGDIVTIAGFSGVVESLSLRFTRLRDLDGNVHIVPNSSITVVTNQSLGYSAVNFNVSVAYNTDIDKVTKVINQVGLAMVAEPEWQATITEPIAFLRVDSFRDSSIDIKALGKVIPGEQWAVAGEFRKRLKVAFEKNGIVIPYPQIVVHGNQPK